MSPLIEPGELAGFPAYELTPKRELARVHRAANGPWWFNSDRRMRFDLAPSHGTCYLAEEPIGAYVEVFRVPRVIPEQDVKSRRLALLHVPRPCALADCTKARSRKFGVTLEIGAVPDYALTQRWASAFAALGFDGIRYPLRHDPSGKLRGIALFGDAGQQDWPAVIGPIPESLIVLASRRFGVRVVPDAIG